MQTVDKVDFAPITPNLGAYVRLSADEVLDEGVPGQLLDGLGRFGMLLFPQIMLSDEGLVSLTNQMGEMEAVRSMGDSGRAGELGIYRITLDQEDAGRREYAAGNNYWHMDGTAYKVPGKGTLLKCEVPPKEGGDTGFANLFAAYEALPSERRQCLVGLRVVHCLESVGRRVNPNPSTKDIERWNKGFPRTEHPLVWQHIDGRKSLVIGSSAYDIVGMPHEEGYAMIQELTEWCTQPAFTYRHTWRKGDLVIFNNPGLLHRSYPYNVNSGRLMHRTTLKGYEAIV